MSLWIAVIVSMEFIFILLMIFHVEDVKWSRLLTGLGMTTSNMPQLIKEWEKKLKGLDEEEFLAALVAFEVEKARRMRELMEETKNAE